MNVFIIPSWFPSYTDHLTGIFIREQASMLSEYHPDLNIGISTWGQNDDRLLLWTGQPFKSLKKLFRKPSILSHSNSYRGNLTVFFSPAYTWTNKWLDGNMRVIMKANEQNYKLFCDKYGTPDIIHAHVGYPAGFIASRLSEKFKIPYIITEHMSPFPHQGFLKNNRLWEAYNKSSMNIAVSQGLAESMKRYNIPRLKVIFNPVDENFFSEKTDSKPKKRFVFLTIGRIVEQKGIDVLLKAFALIAQQHPVELRIGGEGFLLKKYRKLAHHLGLTHHVKWLGTLNREGCRDVMQACDAFVLASRHESMGIVVAEAMACGKPVISTKCGGPEYLVNKDSGFLVDREDPEALARAMLNMINSNFNPEDIRWHFEQNFSANIITSQIRKVYDQIVFDRENP